MGLFRVSASRVSHILLSHFHGDHCLGLPGVLQRIALETPGKRVEIVYPGEQEHVLANLLDCTLHHAEVELVRRPVRGGQVDLDLGFASLRAAALDHGVTCYGYRLQEPDKVNLLPERLAEFGVSGPLARRLKEEGKVEVHGREVVLGDVGVRRPGQSFAYVTDTRKCEAALKLAENASLLLCEATYLHEHADLAQQYAHMTAAQAGELAAEARAGALLLTHFSPRHNDTDDFAREAGAVFPGAQAARDGDEVEIPRPARPFD
jgi:ribonuclease Z